MFPIQTDENDDWTDLPGQLAFKFNIVLIKLQIGKEFPRVWDAILKDFGLIREGIVKHSNLVPFKKRCDGNFFFILQSFVHKNTVQS